MRCKECGAVIDYSGSNDGIYWSCQDCGANTEQEID
jgi:predicted  nucleic acid-binding Zn-ribbon protein